MRISDWSSDVCSSDLLAATHTSRYDAQIFPDTPVESRLAVLGDTGWAPKWKVVTRLTWIHGNTLSATLNGRYISRSEEHTSELQSLMRISYAVFCLKKKTTQTYTNPNTIQY